MTQEPWSAHANATAENYHVLVTTLCSNYSPYYIARALLGCILPKLDVKANLLLLTRKMLPSPFRSHKEDKCR